MSYTPSDAGDASLFDPLTLDRVLSVGGQDLREALVTQILADLERLRREIGAGSSDLRRRAAHEVKGLAATIGAEGLARLAGQIEAEAEPVSEAGSLAVAQGIERLIARLTSKAGPADE